MGTDDVELCCIYGQMAREYLGTVPWEDCVARLEAGWLRLRHDDSVAWDEAEPLIRAFWELAD
jgi:hypothetical protein